MASPQRKTNSAAFTSALKQVFYIHKNIVAELCAQLDVVTDECKLLKANAHITKSSGKCESCIHLEKMNRSLQEHFNSLLQEKDTGIKTLEKQLQILTGKANTVSSQSQKGNTLLKEVSYTAAKQDLLLARQQGLSTKNSDAGHHPSSSNDVCAPPLNPCSQEETNLCDSELVKGHSKLRLAKHGKRHSRYVEEQREIKRAKLSPGAAARSNSTSNHSLGSKENNVLELNETIFVADTVCNTQVRNFTSAHKNVDNESDNEQSQRLFVVPETLSIDASSNSEYEHEKELVEQDDVDDDNPKEVVVCTERNYHPESFLYMSGGRDKGSKQTENVTFLNDDDIHDTENNNRDNTSVNSGRKQAESKAAQLLKEPVRKSVVQGENSIESVFQQSSYDRKVSKGEAATLKGPLPNSINVKMTKEGKSNVNDVTLINEESSHHIDVVTENTSGSISTCKPNCHMLRGNGSVLARNAANQKEPENAISESKVNSLVRDHSVGIMKENITSSKSVWQATLSQTFTDQDRLIHAFETGNQQKKVGHLNTEEGEKLQIAEAIRRSLTDFRNTQSTSKRSKDASLEANFPKHGSVKIITARKCNSTNEGKEMARNRLENSFAKDITEVLSLSLQSSSELLNQEHGETIKTTKSTEHRRGLLNSANTSHKNDKISDLTALEPNGSLNPEIHLTEYLDSEMTEKQRMNQTFCSLDETIAPNLVSQYMVGSQQNQDTSQITKLNTETNRRVQIQQNDNNNKMENGLWEDGVWQDGDESIFNDNVFSNEEDDPELIEPSPQQTFQSRSQLYSSIPASSSSYKFIHKKPQAATKSALQEIGEPEMINNEDSDMDGSQHLLHEKSDLNLDQSAVPHMVDNPPPQTLLDSFDRVPKSQDIEFPHVSVVRKKSERSKLQGFSCKQCYEYYKNSGLSEEALQQKKNECSRHRERYCAPATPEHFWSLGFPDTAEMIERRQKYDSNESPVAASPAPRRRQRLEKKF